MRALFRNRRLHNLFLHGSETFVADIVIKQTYVSLYYLPCTLIKHPLPRYLAQRDEGEWRI